MAPLVYAYCAVRGATRPRVGRDWPRLPDGGAVRALRATRTMWLLVADVPPADFQAAPLAERVTDVEWLARCGAAHHEVIARAARRRAVAPFRLLTVFRTDEAAIAEAVRRRSAIDRALVHVNGCREWVVRAAVDPGAGLRQPRSRGVSGTAYLRARAAARRDAAVRPPAGAVTLAREFAAALSAKARATSRRRPSEATGLLLDMALLVPRGRERDVLRIIRGWTPRFAGRGCRVWQTGPWPPYSFVTVERSAARGGGRG